MTNIVDIDTLPAGTDFHIVYDADGLVEVVTWTKDEDGNAYSEHMEKITGNAHHSVPFEAELPEPGKLVLGRSPIEHEAEDTVRQQDAINQLVAHLGL